MRLRFRRSGKPLVSRGAGWAEWSHQDGFDVLYVNLPIDPALLRNHGWERRPPSVMDAKIRCTTDHELAAKTKQLWWWDGNRSRPTVSPSVSLKTGAPGSLDADIEVWHGYIKGGELKPCEGFDG